MMPSVQYVNMFRKQTVTRTIPSPKRITELAKWLKECQKAISEIPRSIAESEQSVVRTIGQDQAWYVTNTDVDTKWIKFNIENLLGEKAHIIINRQHHVLDR